MDARILLMASTLFMFGEGSTSGADPDSVVRMFLTMTSQNQGAIVGEVRLPSPATGHAIEVVEATDSVFAPTDQQSGLPTGIRVYEGIVIRKPLDKTTPQIAQSLANNERLDDVLLRVYIEDRSTRQLVHRFTYEFDEARVTKIQREMFGRPTTSINTLVPRPEEEVTIRFRTISFIDEVNGTQFTDEWSTAVDVPVPELEQTPTDDVPDEEAEAAE